MPVGLVIILVNQFQQDDNIIVSLSCNRMDFPKDYQWKRRTHAPQLHYFSKPNPNIQPQSTLPASSRGRVRIEEYQYSEQNLLGSGYTSKVYLGCLTEDMKRQVAIKVIDKRRISRQKQNLELLKQEISIHQQLDHPNIVKCYQTIQKKDHYYIILEYCPQGTLDSFIKKHERLAESTTVAIMEQVIAGYRYLLERKVLHRDLKPPNILKAGNNWKICDFGFSVMGKKNMVGEINVGTPAYMAPESLERTYYSPKTDFFSLGVICYQMLFGSAPWQHKNQKVLLSLMQKQGVCKDHLVSLKNRNLAEFIMKCCEPLERKRMSPQEFQEFSFWKEYETEQITTSTSIKIQEFQSQTQMTTRPSSKTLSSMRGHALALSNCPSLLNFSTVRGKKESIQQLFQGNRAVIQRQLYVCQILIALLKNHSLLEHKDQSQKDLFLTVLSKHVGYMIRRVKHQKLNYLCLKKWEDYIKSQDYLVLAAEATALHEKAQAILKSESRRKSIVTIRVINKKYDELTYDKHLSLKCVSSLKEFMGQTITSFLQMHQNKTIKELQKTPQITQTLHYLSKYYDHIKGLSIGSEESRSIAINQDYKIRSSISDDFKGSKLPASEFWRLKGDMENELG